MGGTHVVGTYGGDGFDASGHLLRRLVVVSCQVSFVCLCGAIGLDSILAYVGLLPEGGTWLSDAWQMLYASAHG
eukprot:12791126-Heterocapsa_arctica.AAC.1